MVHQEPSSLSNFVSPQIPMMLESSAVHATRRFSESGVTVYREISVIPLTVHYRHTYRIGVDSEDVLIEGWVNTNDIPHLMIDLELERSHSSVEMNPVEVLHDQNLTVTLSTVTGLGAFCRLPNFDHDNVPMRLSAINKSLSPNSTHGTTWPSNS